MSEKTPTDLLACMLKSANENLDLFDVAGMIRDGRWPVDTGYSFEESNLIEIAIGNNAIAKRTTGAIAVVQELGAKGVPVNPGSWRKSNLNERAEGSFISLYVKALGQGADGPTLAGAITALSMIQAVKPVKGRAAQILEAIDAAGGPHAKLQGLDLIVWIAVHDFPTGGGCAIGLGNSDETATRDRIRKLIYTSHGIDRSKLDEMGRLILDFRIASCDKNDKENHESFKQNHRKFFNTASETIMHAVNQASASEEVIKPVLGNRLYWIVETLATGPGKYSFSAKNIYIHRLDQFKDALAACCPIASLSDDYFPDFSLIMVEKPEWIASLFKQPHAAQKAGRSLFAKSIKCFESEADRFSKAIDRFYSLVMDLPRPQQERTSAWIERNIEKNHLAKGNGKTSHQTVLLDKWKSIAAAINMQVNTGSPVKDPAQKPAIRF